MNIRKNRRLLNLVSIYLIVVFIVSLFFPLSIVGAHGDELSYKLQNAGYAYSPINLDFGNQYADAILNCVNPERYRISIQAISGGTGSDPYHGYFYNPITISGTASATKFAGLLSQYHVRVVWGDGKIDDDVTHDFQLVDEGKNFEGTWGPVSHNYLQPGHYKITVILYHQNEPGIEKAKCSRWIYVGLQAEPVTYTMSIDNTDGGTVVSPGIGSFEYESGTAVQLSAEPWIGYHFVGWSGDVETIDNVDAAETTIVMNGNKRITAVFELDNYTLDIIITGQGNVQKNPDQDFYNYGEEVTLTASPASGWRFSGWSGDLSGTDNPAVLVMDGDKSVTATFTEIPVEETYYTLTINKEPEAGGEVSGAGSYAAGTVVPIEAQPAEGYRFTGWGGDVGTIDNANSAVTTIVMNGNKVITANFAVKTFTITASAGEGGSIEPFGVVEVQYGEDQTFTITPAMGYEIEDVLVDGNSVGAVSDYTFTNVVANHTIQAVFALEQNQEDNPVYYIITATAGTGGTISPSGSISVVAGTDQSFTITPYNGYYLKEVLVDGINQGAVTSYTFTGVNANHTIHAVFAYVEPPISPTQPPTPEIIPAGSTEPLSGGSFTQTEKSELKFTVDFEGRITVVPMNKDGAILQPLMALSPDGTHSFEMSAGTVTLDREGKIVNLITIRNTDMPSIPDDRVAVTDAYNFEPSGVSFSQPVVITLGYDVNKLPKKIQAVNLSYFEENSGWVDLKVGGGIVAEAGRASAQVNHFTTFAVLAKRLPPEFRLRNLIIQPTQKKYWEFLPFVIFNGKQVTIFALVANEGGMKGTFTGVLKVNGKETSSFEQILDPEQSQILEFGLGELKSGMYTVELGGLSGEFSSSVWINWWLIFGIILAIIAIYWLIRWYATRKQHSNQNT